MIRTIYSTVILIILLACQQVDATKITAEELKDLQSQGVVVVDIRTEKEYAAGHIPGVSNNIDYTQEDFLRNMDVFDKSKPIVIHCARGGRSGKASILLQEAGFLKIFDYVGGFNDWKKRGESIAK